MEDYMILIIGGRACGKEEYARELTGITPVPCGRDEALTCPVIADFQETVRLLDSLQEPLMPYLARLIAENPDAVVLCDEVGMGVVPLEAKDRTWRENVGRACTELAKHAQTVTRVVCGIPVPIKPARI